MLTGIVLMAIVCLLEFGVVLVRASGDKVPSRNHSSLPTVSRSHEVLLELSTI